MKKKATSWEDNIWTEYILAQEAWKCLFSTIIKNLDHPLAALTISINECCEIITIIKDTGLPYSSIRKKFPPDLFHGTSDYLGLSMDKLYIIQGYYQI